MKKLVDQLITITNIVLEGGKSGHKARLRHTEKGKLLSRDRIKYLLDHK